MACARGLRLLCFVEESGECVVKFARKRGIRGLLVIDARAESLVGFGESSQGGENIGVARFVRYAGQGYVGQYIHLGGKIGVQVEIGGVTPAVAAREEFVTLVKEIAMQIAAASPVYVSRETVPADVLDREKAIYRAQMENAGKPANVLDKIVEGKLGSFYSQFVLPDQPSIRDPKMSVKDVLAAANKTLGASVSVKRFVRLKVGEGAQ